MLQVRTTTPTPEETTHLTELGLIPELYCAFPVTVEMDTTFPGDVQQVRMPDGSVRLVLLTRWTVAVDLANFNVPSSRVLLPDQAIVRSPLDKVLGSIMSYWLIPRANLSAEGRAFLEAWDFAAQPLHYREGFEAAASEDRERVRLEDILEGDQGPDTSTLADAEFYRGYRDACDLARAQGWEAVDRRRALTLQAMSGTLNTGTAGGGPIPGTCPLCKRATVDKYCTGTLQEPHKMKRVVRQPVEA